MASSSGNLSSALQCDDSLLNPLTPMAFLPPHLAFQAKIFEFVIACSLAVLIWDQLHTLSDDYQLAFKMKFRWPTAVYFICRISNLVHLVGKNVQLNSQIDNCKLMEKMVEGFFVFARPSIALLMYIRVCAVYNMNKVVVLFFGITWLGVIASAATPFGAIEGIYIGPTKYCTARVKHDYLLWISVVSFINDALIFLAIMYKLGMADIRRNPTSRISNAWKPTGHLQTFTRVFLQDSQIYYAIAFALNFATLVTFFAADKPPESPFRYMLIYPDTAVVNIMACRVFRNVKFGRQSNFLMPTHIDAGNLPQLHRTPGRSGDSENSYHMGDMTIPKESLILPTTESDRLEAEKPGTYVGRVEITKVIEFTRN